MTHIDIRTRDGSCPGYVYRPATGPYEPMDPHKVFSDPGPRKVLMEKYMAFATPANIMSDTRAFLDYLAAQPDVRPVETYPARRGWVFRDTPVDDAAAAERHWRSLIALFEATLQRPQPA